MHLIFVRHGETESNSKNRKMGQRIDDELDAHGLEQAKEVLDQLPSDFTLIYSSPLKRALHTAEIIAVHFNKKIVKSPDLMERDFGHMSGKTFEEMESETGLEIARLDKELKYDYSSYGGESVEQVRSRLEKFLSEVKANHRNHETLVVVTHYGIISLMNQKYQSLEHHRLTNTSIHKFEI